MPARLWRGLPPSISVPRTSIVLAVAYFACATLSMSAFGTNTPIWFSNALAVAVLLQLPPRAWPLPLALIYVVDCAAMALIGESLGPAAALADVGEILLALTLISWRGGPKVALSSVTGLAWFIVICLAVPLVSASWGALVMHWGHGVPWLPEMTKWYAASALGMLVVCPSLLIWLTPALVERPTEAQFRLSVLLALVLAVTSLVVFRLGDPDFLFITFPMLLLLVWHRGLVGASVGSVVMIVVGLIDTLAIGGGGAIAALHQDQADPAHLIRALQIYLGALTLSSLPLAVVLADQRRLAAELSRVAEARSEFLAAMSHEIRTPMTGVLGMVDLIDAEQPSQRQQQQLASIRASGRHLLNVLNDILDFSRIETGRLELEAIDFSLPTLLEQVQQALQPLARERGIELSVGLANRSPPIVRGDPTRLRQILLNLAGNAIKFTPRGSVVVLAAQCPAERGACFRFEVRDTGIGIAEEHRAHIFDAFTQADHSTTRRYGGSGLGLAISKRLVDAMGGEIGVDSTLGEGSLFWFEVPLALGDVADLQHEASAAILALAPRRILLAEDVELNRDIIRTMLQRDGHEVATAKNGREAVKRVQQERFDLVLMDVHMPVMDGLQATRAIRALKGPTGSIPIVALTANVMAAEQEKCRQAGMDGVLMKPIEWELVREAIAQYGAHANGGEDAVPEIRAEEGVEVAAAPAPSASFDPAVLADLANILSDGRLSAHVKTLDFDVATLAASYPGDPQALAELAHRIVSQAGMFGLSRLSDQAAAVEEACRSGEGGRSGARPSLGTARPISPIIWRRRSVRRSGDRRP